MSISCYDPVAIFDWKYSDYLCRLVFFGWCYDSLNTPLINSSDLFQRLFLLPKPIMDFVLSSECMGFLFARCRVISVVPQNHVSHIFRDSIVLCSITSTMQGRECDTNNVRMYADMVSSIYTIESRYITNFISHSVCDAANSIRILECALICAHFSRCNCKRNSMN